MTTVNPQITDAVTEANVKVLGDSHQMALGILYQTVLQSVALAIQNAVYAQAQMYAIAAAATGKGVSLIYSVDTAAAGGPQEQFESSAAEVKAAMDAAHFAVPRIDGADDAAYGTRALADAVAASLHGIGEATCANLLRVLQIAATSACIKAMIEQPEKAAAYEEVLASIRKIVRG